MLCFKQSNDTLSSLNIGIEQSIKKWLTDFGIADCFINKDHTINVYGTVYLQDNNLVELPPYIKFNIVTGSFLIGNNKLISLIGCPNIVLEMYGCSNNMLSNLEHCPKIIGKRIFCYSNLIEFSSEYVKSVCDITEDSCIINKTA